MLRQLKQFGFFGGEGRGCFGVVEDGNRWGFFGFFWQLKPIVCVCVCVVAETDRAFDLYEQHMNLRNQSYFICLLVSETFFMVVETIFCSVETKKGF